MILIETLNDSRRQTVYNVELRRMETVHQYGCASLEKGSSASHLTCNSFRSPHRTPKSIACCYEGDYCNLRITPPPYRVLPNKPVIFVSVILSILNNLRQIIAAKKTKKQERSSIPEADSMLCYDSGSGSGSGTAAMVQRTVANDLIIEKIIGKGRYGEVRIAKFRGSLVAVKSNDNGHSVAEYVAADIFSMDSLTQMILVTDYHPHGSLYDYLQKEQALTTIEALQLAYSSICGIEHLHASVIGTGSRRKPQIAHRDIKSKNIIVKRPGMCCIADFGLAVRYEDRLIPEKVNIQVGTKRYMAPEVIKKTLNQNFFAEFKMADMYSYALVIWEIARKVESADVCRTSLGCSESGYGSASSESKMLTHKLAATCSESMRNHYKVQQMQKSSDGSRRSYPYEPPFGELVDSDPSFAEMEKIVCGANGIRPPLEPSWTNGSNVHLQKMIGLMVDCWHHSPHCRHTALKVKITLGEVIEDLLQLQNREVKERNVLPHRMVDRTLINKLKLGALNESLVEQNDLVVTS
ncbi:kinase domain protein [Dictyocaulus viviparus]|uniref:receptor protein serine/threonine kinase n=1 Tax=Dictyocaulus viviparus TaxID=29172 RepID=A0A0D8Y961_DICVI|nr:kinase domain protein [Dictyocaulus viviparus]